MARLREFLLSRSARISPAEAGLAGGGARRRTPGLRREGVAVLAGVGVSWYQWLEQGRAITVSPQVLDPVGRVLRPSSAERRHPYVLAGLDPPAPEADPRYADMCEGLHRLIDTWLPYPAHLMDAYGNAVMYDDAAGAVPGTRPGITRNCLVAFFTDPLYRARTESRQQNAAHVAAQYRAACSERPGDDGPRAVADEVGELSPEFAEPWQRRDIAPGGQVRKEREHPVVGTLVVESARLRIPARPDLAIVLHTPLPEADTAAKAEWPASPEGRRGSMHPVAGCPGSAPYALGMTETTASAELDAEDRKIITLARSARARNGVPEGAAVRDETGRTYVAGTVALDSLQLSAVRTAVAMAVASGAKSLEAAAVVTEADTASEEDRAAVRDLGGPGTPVLVAGPDGALRVSVTAG